MNTKLSKQSIAFNIAGCISLIMGILCLLNNRSEYKFIGVVPILYALLFLSPTGVRQSFSLTPGYFMLFFVSGLRFLIYPCLLAFFGKYIPSSSRLYYSDNNDIAFMLYIYEMIVIAFTIILYKRKSRKNCGVRNTSIVDNSYRVIAKRSVTVTILIIFSIILLILIPSLKSDFNFVFSNAELVAYTYGTTSNAFGYLIVNMGKNALNSYLIVLGFIFYSKRKNKFRFLIVIFCAFISLLYMTGGTRGSIIVPAVVSIFVLVRLFPTKRKSIFILCGFFVFIMLAILTIRKSLNNIALTNNNLGSWLSYYIEIYYSGIDNYSTSIEVKKNLGFLPSITTSIFDVLYYVPGLGTKLINTSWTSSRMFNNMLYGNLTRTDAVIPTSGQGLIYFGYFFSVLPVILFVILALKFDEKIENETKLWKIYMFSMFAVYFGNNHACNVSILSQQIIQIILPVYFIYLIGDRIKFSSHRLSATKQ